MLYSNNSKICSITFILVDGIEDVVQKTLEELKNNQLIPEYESHRVKITEVLKEAAQKEETLTTEMVDMIDNNNMREVEQKMLAILGQERVDLIKQSFDIETYIMKVVGKPGGQKAVQVYRNNIEFQPERMLKTITDVVTAIDLQGVSLIVEAVMLVYACAGIRVSLTAAEMRNVVQEVEVCEQQSAFRKALDRFLIICNEAGNKDWEKAKAFFYFLKESYSLEIFWIVIKLISKDMSKWETIRAIAESTLMVVAAFASKGFALIARIVLAVNNAVYVAEKIIH